MDGLANFSRLDPQVHAEGLKVVSGAVDLNACSGKVNAPEVLDGNHADSKVLLLRSSEKCMGRRGAVRR